MGVKYVQMCKYLFHMKLIRCKIVNYIPDNLILWQI